MDKLEILILEDVEDDAKLVERALRAGGIEFSARRAETREAFLLALEVQRPNVILADYRLPHFDGRSALKLAQELLPLTPVIIVTGTLIDEVAVEILREGAADYVLKDRLARLPAAVRRALAEAEGIRDRKQAEKALRASELRYRRLFETALDGILILKGDSGTIIDVNPFLSGLLGYRSEEMIGMRVSEIGPIRDVEAAEEAFRRLQQADFIRYENLPLLDKAGRTVEVEVIGNAYLVDGVRFIQCNIRDVRERIAAQRRLDEQLAELRLFQKVTVDRELRLQELEVQLKEKR
jgi:PAS domain S-box-containing protein